MSASRGVPLVCTYAAQRLGIYEFLTVHDDTVPTHFALTATLAEARERVIEAARSLDENYDGYSEAVPEILGELRAAIDELRALEATDTGAGT